MGGGAKPGPWSGSPTENSMLVSFLNIFSKRPRILQNHHGNMSPVVSSGAEDGQREAVIKPPQMG